MTVRCSADINLSLSLDKKSMRFPTLIFGEKKKKSTNLEC